MQSRKRSATMPRQQNGHQQSLREDWLTIKLHLFSCCVESAILSVCQNCTNYVPLPECYATSCFSGSIILSLMALASASVLIGWVRACGGAAGLYHIYASRAACLSLASYVEDLESNPFVAKTVHWTSSKSCRLQKRTVRDYFTRQLQDRAVRGVRFPGYQPIQEPRLNNLSINSRRSWCMKNGMVSIKLRVCFM